MKAFIALCITLSIGFVHCGVLPQTTLVRTPSLDSAIVKSDRIGGNFAYSTVEGHAYTALTPVVQKVAQPVGVSYTAHQIPLGVAHTPVALSQPLYSHQSIFTQPIYSQILGSSPILSSPIASYPSYPIISQIPGLGQYPVFGQNPIVGGVAEIPAAPAAPANPAPTPVEGNVVDDDTVSVESA